LIAFPQVYLVGGSGEKWKKENQGKVRNLLASCIDSKPHKIYLTKKDKEGDAFNMNRNTGSY
jgi:hypothetical protein